MQNQMLKDRIEAGLLLSEKLKKYQNSNSVVLAVPRGGVPVAATIAKSLHLPLDIVLSKKIGHPYNKEFAIGAVSMDSMLIDEHPDVPKEYIETEIVRLRKLMREKYEIYMGNRTPLDIKGKNAIVVDDGIATGNTLLVSINMLRKRNPAKIIVAVPVIPYDTVPVFEQNTDEFIYLIASKYFRGVGGFYEDFNQVEDDEVIQLLSVSSRTE
ncbi:phosphoribosyltransferase [Flavobacterium sp. ZS1P70]|uniref:Phosphoribosyltransferase n=1 Tax=Flavobacterium zhoui TaxID=3230414 RepID=A0ABW6I8B6_9FLAO